MNEPKELEIIIPDEIREEMEKDPELASVMREMFAMFRQAHHAVQTGQHETFDDAMLAITGSRPEKVEDEDEWESVIRLDIDQDEGQVTMEKAEKEDDDE